MPRCTKIRGLRSNITHQTFVNSSSVNIKYNITSDLKHQIFFNNSFVNVKHNTTSELKNQNLFNVSVCDVLHYLDKHFSNTVQFFDFIYWEFDKDFFNQVSYVESLLFDFTNDSTIENGLIWDTGFWDKNNFFWNSIDFKDVVQIYLNTL